jgi:hypothetical protein
MHKWSLKGDSGGSSEDQNASTKADSKDWLIRFQIDKNSVRN